MAGAYLEIFQQDTYQFTSNVLLSGVPQSLDGATIWFVAQAADDYSNVSPAPFINLNSAVSNISITNGTGSNVNSVVQVNLGSDLTSNLNTVNSGFWSLVAKTSAGRVYTLDRGRIAVTSRVGVSSR